jgi:RNA polymerase sigma factor (sigma-70 family)
VHFVYGAARRILGDACSAEDVAQAVFMLLIQKSPRLPSDAALAVWLHRTTGYACANARKTQQRRHARELRAAVQAREAQSMTNEIDARDEREHLLPLLDEAITQLGERDRSGVILCYFQRRSFREIGAILGVTEEAARKRVSRSIDRMREYFLSRGVATFSAAPIVAALANESSLVAPAALVSATSKLATVTHLAALAYPSAQIAQKVMHAMLMWKVKLATAACAGIVATSVVTATAIQQIGSSAAPTIVASSAVLASVAPFDAKVSDATEVRFLGIAKWGAEADEWCAIDGSKIDDPRGPFARDQMRARPGVTHQLMLHIVGHNLAGGYAVDVKPSSQALLYDLTPDENTAFILVPFTAPADRATVDVEVRIADGEWKTIISPEHCPGVPLGGYETEHGGIVFTHVSENEGGGSIVYVSYETDGEQFDVVAVDTNGNEHRCTNINGGKTGGFRTARFEFALPPDQITSVAAKVRPFNRLVVAKNVTLDPSKPSKPVIEVSEIKPEGAGK